CCLHGEMPGRRKLSLTTAQVLNSYVERTPPKINFFAGQRVRPSVRFGLDETVSDQDDDRMPDPKTEAVRLLSFLLLTEARFAICKCRYMLCSKYFLMQRVK